MKNCGSNEHFSERRGTNGLFGQCPIFDYGQSKVSLDGILIIISMRYRVKNCRGNSDLSKRRRREIVSGKCLSFNPRKLKASLKRTLIITWTSWACLNMVLWGILLSVGRKLKVCRKSYQTKYSCFKCKKKIVNSRSKASFKLKQTEGINYYFYNYLYLKWKILAEKCHFMLYTVAEFRKSSFQIFHLIFPLNIVNR